MTHGQGLLAGGQVLGRRVEKLQIDMKGAGVENTDFKKEGLLLVLLHL